MTDGLARVERIGKLGDPATEQPTQPVVIESVTRRGAVSIAAVVLAAGEASRFGTPKQRLLLPEVLERLEQSPVDEIVVVAGAHTLETPARVVTCAGWKRGPGASLASGLAALGSDVEAAVVVLADGPDLAPESVERVIDAWRARRWRHRRGVVRRRAWSSAARRPRRLGRRSPTRASVSSTPRLVPCDDLGAPGRRRHARRPARAAARSVKKRREGEASPSSIW